MNKPLLTIAVAIASIVPTVASANEGVMHASQYGGPAWSPYLVGALIGVLSMLTFYFSNKALGASTAYARVAGLIGKAIAPRRTQSMKFFQKKEPKIDWGIMLVVGVIIGAFVAAWTGGELTGQYLPQMWQDRFGADSGGLRTVVAFGGGLLMAFGARMAGGCTSGHGISGTLQLSVGSWIAAISFFVGGIAVAMMLF